MRFVITVLITIAFILAIYFLTTRVILPLFGIDIISEQHSSDPVMLSEEIIVLPV